MKSARLFLLISLVSFAAVTAGAQTPLPPAAQEALDNGIIAAKLPDYALALKYFEEARVLAPRSGVIFYNIGLAESKLPGRELRAIAWLSAYLLAEPQAGNADAIRQQIKVLRIKAQSDYLKLLDGITTAVEALPETPTDEFPSTRTDKALHLSEVAGSWASIGEYEKATKLAGEIRNSDNWRDSVFIAIAENQATRRAFNDAAATLGKVTNKSDREKALSDLAAARAKPPADEHKEPEMNDWLKLVEAVYDPVKVNTLKKPIFLDRAAFLKAMPPPNREVYDYYFTLRSAVGDVGNAQRTIGKMLDKKYWY